MKCQCPEKGEVPVYREDQYSDEEKSGMNHKPNECKGTNEVKLYVRDEKKLWLCSCCNVMGDTELNPRDTSVSSALYVNCERSEPSGGLE